MGGVRANIDAAGGGTYLIYPLVKLKLSGARQPLSRVNLSDLSPLTSF